MCKHCVDYARKLWPDKGPQEIDDILWSRTAYPAGDFKQVRPQLDAAKVMIQRGYYPCIYCGKAMRSARRFMHKRCEKKWAVDTGKEKSNEQA